MGIRLAGLMLVIVGALFGCGGGGGQATGSACKEATASAAKTVAASVAATTLGNGVYIIQGDTMDGVAGIDMSISYPYPDLSSPSVAAGGLISGAMMVANTNTPGKIKIAIINSKAFSGSGTIATITFANKGTGSLLISTSMINSSESTIGSAQGTTGSTSAPGIPFTTISTTTTSASPVSACP